MKTNRLSGYTMMEIVLGAAIAASLTIYALTVSFEKSKATQEKETIRRDPQANPLKTMAALTVGHNSFVPLDLDGDVRDNSVVRAILTALGEFEKNNPEKKVLGWSVEKQQSSNGSSPRIFGLWIHHEPVTLKLEK